MTENQTCPVALDYPDGAPISLDVAAIRTAGTRIRRRRRLAATATATTVVLAVAAGALALRPSAQTPGPATGTTRFPQVADFMAVNPPLHDPTVIATWPEHWTTISWTTADGRFCYAAFRTPAAGAAPGSACEGIESDLSADSAVGATVGMPLPAMAPMEDHQTSNRPGQPNLYPFVGVARGRVAQVTVTVHGQPYTAAVTPLTTWNGTEIGVFQVWIATGTSWDSTDIENVVAYDSHGGIVARQGPWIPPTKPTS